jgi:hypothetical protein
MKKILFALTLAAIVACNTDPRTKLPQTGNFGVAIKDDSAKTVNDVLTALQTNTNFPVKVTGVIAEYCKGEGCWLTLENKSGEALLVEVENKAFVLPRNISGKIAVAEGMAVKEKTDGKTEVKIVAKGILIK